MTEPMDSITDEDIAKSKGYEILGPAYFASRRIAERFMAAFEAEQFQPMIEKFAKDFQDRLWTDASTFLLSDTESNLQGAMRRQVDDCVKGILSGERSARMSFRDPRMRDAGIARERGVERSETARLVSDPADGRWPRHPRTSA